MVAAPLSDEELLERADLAGYARVRSVRNGRAQLRFSKLLKGRPRGTGVLHRLGWARSVTVLLRNPAQPMMLGEWSDAGAYMPGRRIKTHLVWNTRSEAYESLWWNAVSRGD